MKIAGLDKNSFVDYPGKIAATVFTPFCNLDCYYCHNRILLLAEAEKRQLTIDEVMKFLEKRKGFLDGVVITGGEPTLQDGLKEFIQTVKGLGYAVKLDTNGTNPEILNDLLSKGLLDYIAMDIKSPLSKYKEICGTDAYVEEINKSITILLSQGNIEYEFRTTFAPILAENDIVEIAAMIKGAKLYVLQQYRIPEKVEGFIDHRLQNPPHSASYVRATVEKVSGLVKRCETRGLH